VSGNDRGNPIAVADDYDDDVVELPNR
jgi:hypothetical protein